jgi:beta-lactamase regulating signal transducer with metallopeptidase domain
VDTLLRVGLGNAVLAAGLALLAAGVGRVCRQRPALVHALWLLVLLKLVTPPLIQVPLPGVRAEPAGRPVKEPDSLKDTEEIPEVAICPRECRPEPASLPAPAVSEVPPAAVVEAAEPAPVEPPAPVVLPWRAVLLGVWLGGALAWWAVAGLRLLRLAHLLRGVAPAPEVQTDVCRLAGLFGLRRVPGVWFVPGAVSPMLFALGHTPRLLLPGALWERLSPEQRDTLLLHELAHLRRRDHWVRRLELVALGLYWWFPVAWWASRALQEAEEQCCDAWVVWAVPASAPAYASTLFETVVFLSGARGALPAGASGTGHVPLLKRRLSMILRGTPPRSLSKPGLAAVLLLGVGLLPLLPTTGRTEAPARLEPDRPRPASAAPAEKPEPNRAARPTNKVALAKTCQACHRAEVRRANKEAPSWQKAHDEVVRMMEYVQVQRAQLRKAEARLKEALDRFDELRKKATPKARRAIPAEKRLNDLERKLEQLRKEMDGLRREIRPGRKSPVSVRTAPRFGDVVFVNQRSIRIPFGVPAGTDVRELLLYVSVDHGRSWDLAATAVPADKAFTYTAPRDGYYWFRGQIKDRKGKLTPEKVASRGGALRVCVDTQAPVVKLALYEPQEGKLRLTWEARDANLDPTSLTVEYRIGGAKWLPLGVKQYAAGHHTWLPAGEGPVTVRLRVRDRAGNQAEALVKQ